MWIGTRQYAARLFEGITFRDHMFRKRALVDGLTVLFLKSLRKGFQAPRGSVDSMYLRSFVARFRRVVASTGVAFCWHERQAYPAVYKHQSSSSQSGKISPLWRTDLSSLFPEQVTQDGTKIKALASRGGYHHGETIREHLERARQRVGAMGDPRHDETNPRGIDIRASLADRHRSVGGHSS